MPICEVNKLTQSFSEKTLAGPQPHKVLMSQLSGGFDSGVETTAIIKKIANEYKLNPMIRVLATRIVSNVESQDYLEEMKTMFEWVRDNIRYVRDIESVETLQTPDVTLPRDYSPQLGIGCGDCDDHVLLLATLLKCIGFRDLYARIVTFRATEREWKHIYLIGKVQGQIYSMDAIMKEKPFGWECKYFSKKDIQL